MEELKSWAGLAAVLLSIGTALWTWLTSGSKRAMADLEAFKKAEAQRWEKINEIIAAHERRVHSIEGEMKHLPSQQAVHDLQLTLKDMQVELTKVAASAEQSARTSARVENYLLEHGK